MIQDEFKNRVIPRVETLFKAKCVMSDKDGNIILTDTGKAMSFPVNQNTFTLKFSHGLAEDWSNELADCKNVHYKFPFLFIDSEGVTIEGEEVTIRSMILATLGATHNGAPVGNSNARDVQTVKPILLVLTDLLIDTMRATFGVDEPFDPSYAVKYRGQGTGRWTEYVDAIEFTNLKLRIIKC